MLDTRVRHPSYFGMETVKPEPADDDVEPRPRWFTRLLAWPGSAGDRALDRDPTLWMHRDVTA